MTGSLPWFMLLLPFFAAAVIVFLTKPLPAVSSFLAVAATLGSFICACIIFGDLELLVWDEEVRSRYKIEVRLGRA